MLEEYKSNLAEFHSALTREYYLYLAGLKEGLDLHPIYERYSDLFSRDTIDELQHLFNETPEHFETERASLKRMLAFAIERFLEDAAKQFTREISSYESASTVEWKGRRITLQEIIPAIKNEADSSLRHALYDKYLSVIDGSNDLRAERWRRLHETSHSLGYINYLDLFQKLRGVDYQSVARDAENLLSKTESVYISRLSDGLRRDLGKELEYTDRADSLRFFRLIEYDESFPVDYLLKAYDTTMQGLGIYTHSQKNIEIDSRARPRKSSRPFCAAISIPYEVKLVILPVGGQSDYQAFLHEAGHAQHYGWTSPSLRPEFKYTSDYALTETYAFLFNYLITESAWLDQMLSFRNNQMFINSVLLNKLMLMRRYSGKLIYECEYHSGGNIDGASARYSELQAGATRFHTNAIEFLVDTDDAFYSASYLRAWAFEILLREHLKSRFGRRWWTSEKAGNFLKEIWETGDRYTADEMASQIGLGPLGFDPLVDEFNHLLGEGARL